ncbi:MAG: MgtC/SapB family protein [Bacteroidia bacterium]|nr:MgtC/SapB family protein [Sphingobacteriia bacterium]
MTFDYTFILDTSIKLLVSMLLGAIIGAEREYKGRNIGFRTIILITLGSTFFTILSLIIGGTSDAARIASNIITGVGFLGAGAIFRDGMSVKGVTTASLIWISAAIGMACGIAQYEIAIMVTVSVMLILIGFTGVQRFIDQYNRELEYILTLPNENQLVIEFEQLIKNHRLRFERTGITKHENKITLQYEIKGAQAQHQAFILKIQNHPQVIYFKV